jgi:hypothetical protein
VMADDSVLVAGGSIAGLANAFGGAQHREL